MTGGARAARPAHFRPRRVVAAARTRASPAGELPTGHPRAATALALRALRPGGVLVVVGAGLGSGLDPLTILMKEITVHGSFTYVDEFDDAIELLAAGDIKVADLTTAVVPLDQALSAMESLRAAQTMKVLVDPHA